MFTSTILPNTITTSTMKYEYDEAVPTSDLTEIELEPPVQCHPKHVPYFAFADAPQPIPSQLQSKPKNHTHSSSHRQLRTEDVTNLLNKLKRQQADIVNHLNTTTRLIETVSSIVANSFLN
ncbi:hypothetical protein NMY22_g5532 [Coprinellus aureogranulatus]|nr:hypothetical protein NMY22_g5532 [Coprinellus aureogranulatus]